MYFGVSSVSMKSHEMLEELPKYEDLTPHWCYPHGLQLAGHPWP